MASGEPAEKIPVTASIAELMRPLPPDFRCPDEEVDRREPEVLFEVDPLLLDLVDAPAVLFAVDEDVPDFLEEPVDDRELEEPPFDEEDRPDLAVEEAVDLDPELFFAEDRPDDAEDRPDDELFADLVDEDPDFDADLDLDPVDRDEPDFDPEDLDDPAFEPADLDEADFDPEDFDEAALDPEALDDPDFDDEDRDGRDVELEDFLAVAITIFLPFTR